MKICFIILGILLSFHSKSLASLGEKLEAQAQQKVSSGSYRIQMLSDGGIEIREYIDQDNHIFAISWSGRTHPDLENFLGSHFSEYQVEIAKKPAGHQPLMLKTSRMKLHLSGHMRSIRGYAYEDRLLPKDFNLEVLK